MLHHPTLEKLQRLRLSGMYKALAEQTAQQEVAALGFEERLGLLADRELTERENRRLTTRLRQARLKHNACVEDIDYRAPRGLDKALIAQLAACRWIRGGLNLILVGPTETLTSCAPLYLIENSSFPVCHWLFAGYHATHLLRSVTISRFLGSPTVLRRKPASPARPFV